MPKLKPWEEKRMTEQENYMAQALALAREAAAAGEVPVGCVVAMDDGRIVGRSAA